MNTFLKGAAVICATYLFLQAFREKNTEPIEPSRVTPAGVKMASAPSEEQWVGKKAREFAGSAWIGVGPPPRLYSLRGSFVLVDFWATWCPGCVAAIPHLRELSKKYKPTGLVVVALSDESEEVIRSFLARNPVNFIVGAGSRYGQDYDLTGIPWALLVDEEGTIVWQGDPRDEDCERSIALALKK